MAERSPARLVAPVALVAFLIAAVLVIGASDGGQPGDSGRQASTPSTAAHRPRRPRRVYVVRQGDILSSIAEKTGVSVERLEELNPQLDPQVLRPGQRLKLRP